MSDIKPDKLPDTKEIPHIEHERYEKAVRVLTESGQSWKKRNKLIRIADKSEGGWKTVEEYLSDDVANDDDDERIRAAYGRAVKKLKTVKQDKRQNIKKRPAESAGGPSSIAHNGNNGGFFFYSNSPFLSRGPPPPSHLVGTELMTSATTVVCMDIGQKTVKKGGKTQQLPEEQQTERSPDILKVQNVDNFDSFYDYESAIGNVTQIMTRCTFSVINLRQDWDQYVDFRHNSDSIQEILFWKQNIHCLKPVPLLRNNSEFNVFTDASDIGAGCYLQDTDYVAHRQWSVTEATKSSTWREMKAIELTLESFAKVLKHS
ncbi:unnamed protein product [Mytilus edulis]|uniref:Uncharacterized protein n=1 Tax=Mytilus edulis TaxID=6550 RepID=A0A8S3TTJ5_MYTED|nr:unnamed protein product [Mytilus edulis]